MSKEILAVVDVVSNEKGVDREVIFDALETALASATKKKFGIEWDVVVTIDRASGDYQAYRRWQVVEDEALEVPDREITLDEARAKSPEIAIGGYLSESIQSVDFGGRIAAQTARQIIVQKVREAERAQVVEAYQQRIGELVNGTVKRVDKGNVILDLGNNIEALVPREDMIPRETVRANDRLRAYLRAVRPEQRGPQLFLSRTAPELLIKLFTLEVPEIGENLIEIIGASRDPGLRAKISVRARDPRIDPVGACVGMRGSRVQAVSNELCGERVDIIVWDENPAKFVINAMQPAEVESIVMDEETHGMDVVVDEAQLSQAIGKGGQNVRLASQLTGWTLNVMSREESESKREQEATKVVEMFMEQLMVDEDVAVVLAEEGFSSLEEVAYVPLSEMLEIEAFDEDIVHELRDRAKDALLTQLIASEEQSSDEPPAEDLLSLEGLSETMAHRLAAQGIVTREDLAEQAVEDVLEIEGMDEALAGKLIMAARAHWFTDEDTTENS